MSDNKKYYYLKLKENFFDSEEMKVLESAENGYLYSNILLKMYLKSLKSEGRLMFRDNIPYSARMLATVTGHNVDVVDKAIKLFVEFGLIQVLDSGAIYIADIQSFIGESSSEADRKRIYRSKINDEKKELGHLSDDRPPEIEKERELKKELELEKDGGKKSTAKPIVYSSEFSQIWDVIYPHSSDRGSKTQAYKNWLSLLKEGQPIEDLISSAHNYKQHCSIKSESFRYRCSNFYGEKRYFENFITLNLTNLQQEVQNARHSQPTTYTQRCASGADFIRQLADAEASGFDINDF